MLTPPMSSEFQVLSGGRLSVGRCASAIGATVEDGWLIAPELAGDKSEPSDESVSFADPFNSGDGLTRLGFVMGMADFVTLRDAIALARAR